MADFTSVPTVELLTRAADAAGRVAEWATGGPWELDMIQPDMAGRHEYYVRGPRELGPQRHVLNARMTTGNAYLIAASGPDHWRAVEATLRAVLVIHGRVGEHPYTLRALRPLAEQVLQHLGDTE